MRIRITASGDEHQRVTSADPVLLDGPQLDDELQEAHLDLDVGWVVGHVKAGNSGLLERHLVNKRYNYASKGQLKWKGYDHDILRGHSYQLPTSLVKTRMNIAKPEATLRW